MIDATGGYGAGWVDALRGLGRDPIGVQFAGKPLNNRYANKRAEMWFEMVEWIKRGGSLPDSAELLADLTAPTYTFKGDQLQLEPKDAIKARMGRSPDWGDALALTFAFPVTPPTIEEMTLGSRYKPPEEDLNYNPAVLAGRARR